MIIRETAKTRIASLLLAVFMCVFVLVSCDEGSSPTVADGRYNRTDYSESDSKNDNESYNKKPSNRFDQKTRVSLDTTRDYRGLRLERKSDKNDLTGHSIKNNKNNKVSRLTGSMPQAQIAVAAFNAHKNCDSAAYSRLFYNSKASTLTNTSFDYVAYKVIEYHVFGQSDINQLNKGLASTLKLSGSSETVTATEYCRITMEIYKYEPESSPYDKYPDYSADPKYFIATIYKADGEYYIYTVLITG